MSSKLHGLSERWFRAWLEKDAATVERLATGQWRLVMEQCSFSRGLACCPARQPLIRSPFGVMVA